MLGYLNCASQTGANESIIHVDDWQHSIPVPDNHDSHDVQIPICVSLLLQDNFPEAGRKPAQHPPEASIYPLQLRLDNNGALQVQCDGSPPYPPLRLDCL